MLESPVWRLPVPLPLSALVLDVVEIHIFIIRIDLQLHVKGVLRAHVTLALFGLRVVHRRRIPRHLVLQFSELSVVGRDNPHLLLNLLVLELFLQLTGLIGDPLLLLVDLPQLGVLVSH